MTQYLIEEALDAALTLHERRHEVEAEAVFEQAAAVDASRARQKRIHEA